MMYQFHGATDPGRQRPNNEDAILVDEAANLVVLADGMGGYQAGEVASSMAAALVDAELGQWLRGRGQRAPSPEVQRAMHASVDHANRGIFEAANTHAEFLGMGTTLVLGVFRDTQLLLGHVGDSRAYRWRDGVLQSLTRDHSWVRAQLDEGLISPAEAATSPHRGIITRALGVEPVVQLDLQVLDVQPDDLYLLCSDGLHDMLDDPQIAALLAAGGSLDELGERLIAMANALGGRDNISVILARGRGDDQG